MPILLAGTAGVLAFLLTLIFSGPVAARIPATDPDGNEFAIPKQRPVILAVTAALITAATAWSTVGVPWVPYATAAAVSLLVVTSVIDAQTRRLPNIYTLYTLGLSALVAGAAAVTGYAGILLPALIAAGITFIVMLIMGLLPGQRFGMGDVKLGPLLVFLIVVLSMLALPTTGTAVLDNLIVAMVVIVWLLLSFLSGAFWALLSSAFGRKDGIPFGPFMVGAWLLVLAGAPLIHTWLTPTF